MKKVFKKSEEARARNLAAQKAMKINTYVLFEPHKKGWLVEYKREKIIAPTTERERYRAEERLARGLASLLIKKDKYEYVLMQYNKDYKSDLSQSMWIVTSQKRKV